MKKYLIFLISILFSSTCFSQWIVGPRIGANLYMLSGKWSENDDSKNKFVLGPVVGAVGGYEISETFSVNAELLLIKMGGKTKYTYSEEEESRSQNEQEYWIRERFNCIQLAVPIRANFGDNFNFFANVGPYCTYKFGGKWKDSDGNDGKIKWGTNNTTGDDTWYLDPKYNGRFDFGFYFGGGAGKKIGPGRLEVDVRFGLGLIDLNKFENKDQKQAAKDNGYKAYNSRNISISFAYLFGLGGDSPTRFYE